MITLSFLELIAILRHRCEQCDDDMSILDAPDCFEDIVDAINAILERIACSGESYRQFVPTTCNKA